MFNAEGENEKLQCPFDNTHTVIRKHYQTHLLRCKKNHPEIEVLNCPFNAIHVMPEADLLNHLTICPDRKLLTQYQGPVLDDNIVHDIQHAPLDNDDENWDEDDNNVPDFKPTVFSVLRAKREK